MPVGKQTVGSILQYVWLLLVITFGNGQSYACSDAEYMIPSSFFMLKPLTMAKNTVHYIL